jgi:enoyl-CoA hydratase/carnithine racemase
MIGELNRELAGLVELRRDGAVLEIRMVKAKVNAICTRLSRALERAALHLQDDPSLRVGLLTSGCERAFSAGMDFAEADRKARGEDVGTFGEGGFGGITRLWRLNKPLIAVVNAPAVGGGFELALACDLIVMAEGAYFQLPELQRGILPDGGGLQRLPQRVPYNVATAMIWTGDPMTAEEALRWGLAHAVVAPAALDETARAVAGRVARGAPLAQQALKEVLRSIDGQPATRTMDIWAYDGPGFETYARMQRSDDAVEGPRAFLERRDPRWTGS